MLRKLSPRNILNRLKMNTLSWNLCKDTPKLVKSLWTTLFNRHLHTAVKTKFKKVKNRRQQRRLNKRLSEV
jgi:hypothetical protein